MSKFKLVLFTDLEEAKKLLNKYMFLYYKTRIKSLMNILTKAIKDYEVDTDKPNERLFIEEGSDEFVDEKLVKWEKFVYSNANNIKQSAEVRGIENDRIIRKITKRITSAKSWVKEQAVTRALRTDDVFSFFIKIGIGLKWEVQYDYENLKYIFPD